VLAAQRVAAQATEDAARATERHAAELAEWEAARSRHQAENDELRTALAGARERSATLQDALDAAVGAHRSELKARDERAAQVAAAHEEQTGAFSSSSTRPGRTRRRHAHVRTPRITELQRRRPQHGKRLSMPRGPRPLLVSSVST